MTFRPQYQRSPEGGGRTFDTGPPRTNTGLTGLGAVGGATGVGAGALRVIVEFLTQYDAKAVQALEQEITRLQGMEKQYQQFLSAENKTRAKETEQLAKLDALRARFNTTTTRAQRQELLKIRDLSRSNATQDIEAAKNLTRVFAQQTGFRVNEIRTLINEDQKRLEIDQRRARFADQRVNAERGIRDLMQQQTLLGRQLTFFQNLRQGLVPRLGSLALGAIGGIFGGAVVGLGFTAANALLDAIGQSLRDILDPANKAREALAGVADQVNKIADKEGISLLEASKEVLSDYGEAGANIEPSLLAVAAATHKLIEENKELKDILEVVEHVQQLQIEATKERIRLNAESLGIAISEANIARILGGVNPDFVANPGAQLSAEEQRILDSVLKDLATSSREASLEQRNLEAAERAAGVAADLAASAQQRLADEVDRVSNLRISGLQDQLDALGGPSKRTQDIARELERFGQAQQRAAYQSQLAAVQEERYLLLLEQRVRFQGESVNLSELDARGQIVAINARIQALQQAGAAERSALDAVNARIAAARAADQAQDRADQAALKVFDDKIKALQDQGDAQDRLNRLLDIQFKLSQGFTRQRGESIGDFLARRANETRGLLADQANAIRANQIAEIQTQRDAVAEAQEAANARREASIEAMEAQAQQLQAQLQAIERARQAEIDALNEKRERLELEVRLQENAAREQELIDQEQTRKEREELERRLEASRRRDDEETKSRREALEQQIEDERRRAEEATKWLDIQEQQRLRGMVRHAATQSDASAIIGQIQGATRAAEDLEAYLTGLGLSEFEIKEILDPLRRLVQEANAKLQSIQGGGGNFNNIPTAFAKGGMFMLDNSMNFGSRMRFGEEGQEIGVVLSNKVAKILKESQGSSLDLGGLVINRSTDPWQDRQRLEREVTEIVSRMLR